MPRIRTSNYLVISAAALCLACSGRGSESHPDATSPEAHVIREVVELKSDSFLQQMVQEERFSGVALVMREGEVLHARGYGQATSDSLNDVTTAFHIASVTKQFTAAAVLQLVETGAVDLDTSVNEYLPEQYRSPNWGDVKVHHLLSHTSGVPDYAVVRDYYDVVDGWCLGDTVDGMVNEAMAKDLEFSPGSKFEYSNIGFTLLGFLIEHVSGVPYEEYLNSNLFEPMGMESTRVHVIGHLPAENEAEGHRWNEELGAHAPDAVVTLPVTAPDGGIVTTLADFVKWTEIYLGGEQTVLSQESLDAMRRPAMAAAEGDARGVGYGYGLSLSERTLSHGGYIVGFRSHFIVDPVQELLIVVFSNNTTSNPNRISSGLLKLLETQTP